MWQQWNEEKKNHIFHKNKKIELQSPHSVWAIALALQQKGCVWTLHNKLATTFAFLH